ncbi:helix-turn-helix transcriptional regulator [Mycolicibacterium wolinskyi]|uniref:HTH cro/C1-type domain-containing protein n=1 Tax=Mycolicibacterium wolinskyi TaxID=59750 RepID=A0A1X2FJ89_9MYCO|nr:MULTISPECIES: helix-turn-helix transcriptional regulator [Mycolicibacterium]MCV7286063.1 helix-turn-helix transcriptional regulator [Mycolicibacterium wolinskyi]MCV7296259.1 helix-turn-helix transcriptional regulator [Mycolicibacterium goodii]ORX18486.1 hypothetical protein AWC31_14385 [Mycolicibacterium wolinskyi]
MANTLDNLSELIDRHLPARGMNREDLAKTLSVSPSTLSRWSSRMPGAETVRALATALDLPYGAVLAAALRSGGYAETSTDILAGHSLTLVARDPACSQSSENDDEPGAVFTDPDSARRWAHVRQELDCRIADYGHGDTASAQVVIDGAATPEHVVVYRASWDHRTDTVSVSESGVFAEVPSGLDPETALVDTLNDTGKVFAVTSSAVDADTARKTVEDAVTHLRGQGKLLGTEEATGLGFTDHLMHSELMSMRHRAQVRHEERSGEVELPEMSTRIKEFVSKIAAAPQMPYVWGGGDDRGGDTKPWRDPINTYSMQPRDSHDS